MIKLNHVSLFPCDNGLCEGGLIPAGQQGLISPFEDDASLSSGLAQTLGLLIHHCRLFITPTASLFNSY